MQWWTVPSIDADAPRPGRSAPIGPMNASPSCSAYCIAPIPDCFALARIIIGKRRRTMAGFAPSFLAFLGSGIHSYFQVRDRCVVLQCVVCSRSRNALIIKWLVKIKERDAESDPWCHCSRYAGLRPLDGCICGRPARRMSSVPHAGHPAAGGERAGRTGVRTTNQLRVR